MNWTLDATLGVIYTRICRLPKRVLWLSAALYVCVIYIIHDVYIIYEQHAPGNVVLHGGIVKFQLENFFLRKTPLYYYYTITRRRVNRLATVQKLILTNNTHQ